MAATGLLQRFLGAVQIYKLMLGRQTGIVAGTTQTQAGATQLTRSLCYIATCANSGDGVKLPPHQEGLVVTIINAGAQTARVYTNETTGVTIGATAGSTGITLAATKVATFFAGTSGRWDELLTA